MARGGNSILKAGRLTGSEIYGGKWSWGVSIISTPSLRSDAALAEIIDPPPDHLPRINLRGVGNLCFFHIMGILCRKIPTRQDFPAQIFLFMQHKLPPYHFWVLQKKQFFCIKYPPYQKCSLGLKENFW